MFRCNRKSWQGLGVLSHIIMFLSFFLFLIDSVDLVGCSVCIQISSIGGKNHSFTKFTQFFSALGCPGLNYSLNCLADINVQELLTEQFESAKGSQRRSKKSASTRKNLHQPGNTHKRKRQTCNVLYVNNTAKPPSPQGPKPQPQPQDKIMRG